MRLRLYCVWFLLCLKIVCYFSWVYVEDLVYMLRLICCNVKLYSLSNCFLEFVVSFGYFAACLYNVIFFSGDVLLFIEEMVGTESVVSSS